MTTRTKAEQQVIRHESNPYRYFTMMLNMADDDLNPHEYRLLGHYVRWAGHGGSQQESIRQTAKVTRMGKSTVDKTRDALEAKGYIKVVKPTEDERKDGVATQVIVVDRWAENIARYSKGVPNEVEGVYPNKDTGVPKQVQGGVPKQVDSEELETEEPLEKQNTPIPQRDVFADFVETLPVDDAPERPTPKPPSDEQSAKLLIKAHLDATKSVKYDALDNNNRLVEALRLHDAGITPGHIKLYMKRNKDEKGYWQGKNVPWNILCEQIISHFELRPAVITVFTPETPIEPVVTGEYDPDAQFTEQEFDDLLTAAAERMKP